MAFKGGLRIKNKIVQQFDATRREKKVLKLFSRLQINARRHVYTKVGRGEKGLLSHVSPELRLGRIRGEQEGRRQYMGCNTNQNTRQQQRWCTTRTSKSMTLDPRRAEPMYWSISYNSRIRDIGRTTTENESKKTSCLSWQELSSRRGGTTELGSNDCV